jgi:hypothetical protein
MERTSARLRVWTALLCAILVALWGCFLPWKRALAGQNDFLALYVGATLAGTPDLYSPPIFERLQESTAHIRMPAVLFSRPPFYAVLLKPLTALPYRAAYLLFEVLSVTALLGALRVLAPRGDPLWLLGGISIPALTAFINGQDVLLVLAAAAASIALRRRGLMFVSGLALSLCAIKFHFFLLVPVVLIFRKQWRQLGGAAVGLAAFYGIGAAAEGWLWPVNYLKFLQFLRDPKLTPTPYTMPNLHGLVLALFGDAPRVEMVVAVVTVVGVLYVLARVREFELAMTLAVAAGLLINVHTYIQDYCLLMLLPAVAARGSLPGYFGLALLAPPGYFLLMADGPAGAAVPLALAATIASSLLVWSRSPYSSTTAATAPSFGMEISVTPSSSNNSTDLGASPGDSSFAPSNCPASRTVTSSTG